VTDVDDEAGPSAPIANAPFAAQPLDLLETERKTDTVLEVRGELDVATADQLERRLAHLVEAGAEQVILDLTGLRFIDIAGLKPIVRASDILSGRGGSLVVVGAGRSLRRVVKVLGLEGRLLLQDERAQL
jgi:anti-anti-sigma factor